MSSNVKEMNERIAQKSKATKRANRNLRAPEYNRTADL